MNNRQLRNWVFMLYPDNPKHLAAINYLDLISNSLYIKHIAKYDEENEIINKEHFHCIMKFDSPYWLSKLLQDLNLNEEDSHLFHSFKDFKDDHNKQKFKSLEDYVLYLDHQQNDNKPDKYDINDFHGGLKNWAESILNTRDVEKYIMLFELTEFINNYNLEHFIDCRTFTFRDWFKVCVENGYGSLFYREWYKMRDIIKPYTLQ